MGLNAPSLRLLDQLPKYAVAASYAEGWETWNKFGYNDGLQNGVTETIWEQGGIHSILASPETMNVASTNVNDTNGGTGSHGVVIYGVDENWDNIIEVVLLDGTTNAETNNSFYGINRVALFRSGSTQYNEGDITVTASSAGTVQAKIPAEQGSTQQAIFFVSGMTTFFLDFLSFNAIKTSGGGSPVINIVGYVFSYVSNSRYEVFRGSIDTAVENTVIFSFSQPFVVGEKSVLYFEATSNTNNSAVRCRFSGIELSTDE